MSEQKPARKDLYQEATDRIIKALEAGTVPWQKPWEDVDAGPLRNGATGNIYHGINVLMLECARMERHFTDARWFSFKQCQERGYKIRKGAKAERIYFYKSLLVDERDPASGQVVIDADTGKPRQKEIPFLQASPVFNAQEIDGVPPLGPTDVKFTPIEAGEELVKRCPVEIRHGGNRCFFNPTTDSITMVNPEQFKRPEDYYAVLAHEMVHSTATKDRCNREFGKRFGDSAYAFEELVAELGSVMLQTGLPCKIENHASYVDYWLGILKSDKKALFTAAAKANEAAAYILGRPALDAKVGQKASADKAVVAEVTQAGKAPAASAKTETVPADTVIPATIAVVAKLRERRASQSAAARPRNGPALGG